MTQIYPYKAPKFKNFSFGTKLCNSTISRTLISNMTIVFSNSSSKIRKLDIFGAKFKDFYFALNFATRQIWGLLFQLWQCFLQILVGNYPNKALFGHKCKQCLYFWMKPLSIVKNLRTLILKTTIVFSNFSQKYQIQHFPWKLKSFFSSENLSEFIFI